MSDAMLPPPAAEQAPRSVRGLPLAPAPVETLTVEAWRDRKGTPLEQYAPAVAYHAWPEGQTLTEAEYDAAIARAMGARLGSTPITLRHP